MFVDVEIEWRLSGDPNGTECNGGKSDDFHV
jgi:hypothetical protein